jgi:predicted 3-demethylubiquinone-9 3-methyltransferase (glyoxalase superfamily)
MPAKPKQKIVTYLWFDRQAEEAAQFYTSIFKHSKIVGVQRYGDGAPMPKGTAMVVNFQLEGQDFIALNGGPHFKFTEAISLLVNCESQKEVDDLWSKLTADGGAESMCGWLKDKYGLSWQIIPTVLMELLQDRNPKKARAAMQAMLQMKKIDVAELQRAHAAA